MSFWFFIAVAALLCFASKGQLPEESKIIGGTVVSIDKSPFLAAMEERDNASSPFFQTCGCVIVDSLYIISAAHCFVDIGDDLKIKQPDPSFLRIRVGTSLLKSGGTLHPIAQYWVHPKFKVTNTSAGTTLDYDVGVGKLSTPIVFGKSAAKATLIGQGQHLSKGTKVIAAGWGVTTYTGNSSTQLRRAIFSVVEQPECNRQYEEQKKQQQVSQRSFCTYAASKGDCFGDSGGPVYNRTDSVVAGLVSWGTCIIMPNVVTDLGNPEIRSFIREKTQLNL